MKSILPLLVLAACTTYKAKPIPKFDQAVVCSEKAKNYLTSVEKISASMKPEDAENISEHVNKVQFLVKSCYEEFVQINQKAPSFNLCFVTGSDKEGKRDFFDFASSEETMTTDFWECLGQIESTVPLEGLKSVYVVQGFKLFPGIPEED